MQTDHVIGNILACLDEENLSDNTLVIFGSDNGCSRQAKIGQLAQMGHKVSAGFRGSKSDIWEGGHRIPFVVRWPGVVEPDSKSDQLICLTDMFATVAECIEVAAPANSCEDSVSFRAALNGQPVQSPRVGIVHHSIHGHFAYRSKDWKLILARGSGGWSSPTENKVPRGAPKAQLYHLGDDSAEQVNLYESKPEIATQLLEQLTREVKSGRSTEGPPSANDINNINLWKSKPAG